MDEDEDTNRVSLELLISEGPQYAFPLLEEIPRKPPPIKSEKENGEDKVMENGVVGNGVLGKRVREKDHGIGFRKKARVAVENDADHEVLIIEDDEDTIMID